MDRPVLLSVLRLVVAIIFLASCSTRGGVYRENDPQHGEFSATRTILLPVAIAGAVVLVAAAASESSTNHSTNSSVRPSYGSSSAHSTGTVCHFTREVPSGMNKICYYNCLGSGHAMTINAVQLCPLTIGG